MPSNALQIIATSRVCSKCYIVGLSRPDSELLGRESKTFPLVCWKTMAQQDVEQLWELQTRQSELRRHVVQLTSQLTPEIGNAVCWM